MTRPLHRLGTVALVLAALAALIVFALHEEASGAAPNLTPLPAGYLGIYTPDMPSSTAGLTRFESETKTSLDLALYYSGWLEPFQTRFAVQASALGAVTLVQIEPTNVSLAAIAAGRYDAYLKAYAQAVGKFGRPVVIGFGHEMNGNWYSWGNGHTAPSDFVAAWQHIVGEFRAWGAFNVTWLWTINSLAGGPGAAVSPRLWWPGAAYVNWVGIDGYFYYRGETFSTLFGNTIKAIRPFTGAPALISETGIAPAADKPVTLIRLFNGARAAGVLGVVYFDAVGYKDWRLDGPSAYESYRKATRGFGGLALPTQPSP